MSSVTGYLKSLSDEQKKAAKVLMKLFTDTTKAPAKMWGTSIVGFGEYVYHRSNGAEGNFLATGFSLRKSGPTLYIMPGYQDYSALLAKLGPHKLGKSCLYLKNLDEVDLAVIKKLIAVGLKDLKKSHTVTL